MRTRDVYSCKTDVTTGDCPAAAADGRLPPPRSPARNGPSSRPPESTAAPRIDGVLDDAAWQVGHPGRGFTQQEPNLGQPATERTEVRILYDSRNLYIGVHAYQAGGVSAG